MAAPVGYTSWAFLRVVREGQPKGASFASRDEDDFTQTEPDLDFTEAEVDNIVAHLKKHTAAGPDNLKTQFIQALYTMHKFFFLNTIYNACLRSVSMGIVAVLARPQLQIPPITIHLPWHGHMLGLHIPGIDVQGTKDFICTPQEVASHVYFPFALRA